MKENRLKTIARIVNNSEINMTINDIFKVNQVFIDFSYKTFTRGMAQLKNKKLINYKKVSEGRVNGVHFFITEINNEELAKFAKE